MNKMDDFLKIKRCEELSLLIDTSQYHRQYEKNIPHISDCNGICIRCGAVNIVFDPQNGCMASNIFYVGKILSVREIYVYDIIYANGSHENDVNIRNAVLEIDRIYRWMIKFKGVFHDITEIWYEMGANLKIDE